MAAVARTIAVAETALGVFAVEATASGIRRVHLPGEHLGPTAEGGGVASITAWAAAAQIAEYIRGERRAFEVVVDWSAVSGEHRRVLETLTGRAPYGRTVTYGELGAAAGVHEPRDVGVYMNRNPFPIVVPCHRVVAADGLGGYGGGLALKRRLLELEGALPPSLDLGDL